VVDPPLCGIVTSNTNLSGDCMGPLVVAASGITVNLGGHAVTCGPARTAVGIVIFYQMNDHVMNGKVESCYDGIEIFGGSGHDLSTLNVYSNANRGIVLQETSNNDIKNTISSANSDGVDLLGASLNRLDHLQLEQNTEHGIVIAFGANKNVVTSSFLLRAGIVGIYIAGSGNTIDQSTKVAESRVGIEVLSSTGNTIRATSSSDNDDYGILLSTGVSSTTIQSSDASNNGQTGIQLLSAATNNLIMSNKAFGNGSFDLEDDNLDCDDNTWKSNQFGTASQPCIS